MALPCQPTQIIAPWFICTLAEHTNIIPDYLDRLYGRRIYAMWMWIKHNIIQFNFSRHQEYHSIYEFSHMWRSRCAQASERLPANKTCKTNSHCYGSCALLNKWLWSSCERKKPRPLILLFGYIENKKPKIGFFTAL